MTDYAKIIAEAIQLQELKKSTLKRYVKKANKSYDDAAELDRGYAQSHDSYDPDHRPSAFTIKAAEKNHRKMSKRLHGTTLARKKIAKGTKAEK